MKTNQTNVEPGQIWLSTSTGNRWRVVAVDGHIVSVQRIGPTNWDREQVYFWHVDAFHEMVLRSTRPCPACGQPHDPTYIPPARVPLNIRCACCCS